MLCFRPLQEKTPGHFRPRTFPFARIADIRTLGRRPAKAERTVFNDPVNHVTNKGVGGECLVGILHCIYQPRPSWSYSFRLGGRPDSPHFIKACQYPDIQSDCNDKSPAGLI